MNKPITIYTDGSSIGNPGPGGYGIVMLVEGEDYKKEFSQGFKLTTNNRMELLAVIIALEKIKIKTRPSEGNFSFVEMSDQEAKKIFAHLANSGIIVRQLDSYGLPNCLRITIGTREEMEATINSLKGL